MQKNEGSGFMAYENDQSLYYAKQVAVLCVSFVVMVAGGMIAGPAPKEDVDYGRKENGRKDCDEGAQHTL